jgi:hypothetical protein
MVYDAFDRLFVAYAIRFLSIIRFERVDSCEKCVFQQIHDPGLTKMITLACNFLEDSGI